mmetsp:Transcript_76808/g.193982  ORF Transcript_76808/g.193982 Transcript_76808/m.193982 type:complete len:99 (+) Transcript_76808:1275-1571(+)
MQLWCEHVFFGLLGEISFGPFVPKRHFVSEHIRVPCTEAPTTRCCHLELTCSGFPSTAALQLQFWLLRSRSMQLVVNCSMRLKASMRLKWKSHVDLHV